MSSESQPARTPPGEDLIRPDPRRSQPRNPARSLLLAALVAPSLAGLARDFTLLTLDPGHFHAALFQRERLPGMAEEAFVYAPLGPDVIAHLNRVAGFNARRDNPTHWRLCVYTGPDFQERMLAERRGQIVVMSGRNRGKIDRIRDCVRAGFHVLADKPWIIEEKDLPKLESALDAADTGGVIAYDAMTQRFEITAILQRALVNDPDVFGGPLSGSATEPAVTIESVHYLCKEVAGAANLRPLWFFDIAEQGEGLTDVGTHLVDMVQWVLFPGSGIDYHSEIQVLRGTHWPTPLTPAEFQRVTGEKEFPAALKPALRNGTLDYFCNNTVDYTLRGIHVRLRTTWDLAAPPGGKDNELAIFRGSRARVEVRQDPEDQYRREVYVVPKADADRFQVRTAVKERLAALERDFPGLTVEDEPARLRVVIPERLRVSHEEHFARVVQRFLEYARDPRTLPAWEKPNMLAKYYVTTRGVALARQPRVQP